MPAVMCSKTFGARTAPLRYKLLLLAEKTVGANDAEDVVQDTLCTAWQDVRRFNASCDQPALLAWLQAILQYKTQEYICSEAFKRETTLPATTLFEMCDGPGALHWEESGWQSQREELYRRLHNATLSPRQRECALRWVGGETLREIGASLANPLTPHGVHYTIQRAARILRDLDDVDAYDPRLGECAHNLPAALTLQGQEAQWNRVRRDANEYAMRRSVRQSADRTGGR